MNITAIEVKDVSKSYKIKRDIFWALKDVSFSVKKGEALGIIGANGAGKTTILRLLAGVTSQSKGKIEIKGAIAPLIQVGAGFHPELTGRENIYLNGIIMGLSKKMVDKKFNDIVRFAELERFIDTPVKKYSSGMYVRLGFSVAIHVDADTLLIDEILSVGDLSFQRKCLDAMSNIRRSKKTIIFVSHNLSSVRGLCDRVIWIDNGMVKKDGHPDKVINTYLTHTNLKNCRLLNMDVLNLRARWGTGEAEVLSIDLLNNNHEQNNSFEWGSDMGVRVEFRINKEGLKYIYLWICIMNDMGEKICGCISKISGELDLQKKHTYKSTIKNIYLIPGEYTIITGLYGDFLNVPYDRWGESCRFRVTVLKENNFYGLDFHGYQNIDLKWEQL